MLSIAQLCSIILTAVIAGCLVCIGVAIITDAVITCNRDICKMSEKEDEEAHTGSPFGGEM